MRTDNGAGWRQFSRTASAAIAMVVLGGCGVGGIFGSGTSPSQAPTSQEAAPADVEPPAEPDASPEPEAGVPVDADSEVPVAPVESASGATPEEIVAGTIELSIEFGGQERVFQYSASDCFVSAEYILANGTGTEVATGKVSEVGISTSPAELLHEATGTYQADGLINIREAGRTTVSDGRMITVEGHTIPSVFTYRHDFNSAHYVVAWFGDADGADAGAGYVKVNCDY